MQIPQAKAARLMKSPYFGLDCSSFEPALKEAVWNLQSTVVSQRPHTQGSEENKTQPRAVPFSFRDVTEDIKWENVGNLSDLNRVLEVVHDL